MAETKTPSTWQTIRRLVPDLQIHKTWLRLVWLTALLAGIMEFINPYLLKTLTDTAIAQQHETFWRIVGWAILVMLIDIALKYFTRLVSIRYESYTVRDLRDRVTAHIQRTPISYTETTTPEILSRD